MAYDFNAKDVFEMAKQIERNGVNFYRSASESVTGDKEKQMLMNLSKMEEQHEKTFAEMEAALKDKEMSETAFDPDNEAALYLKALADTRVFFEKDIDTASMKAILKAAIIAEKDSIVFYVGMKDLVPEKFGRNKLDEIIKEEMAHIRLLSNRLVSLSK
jgi:rubrerythrin